MDRCTPLDDTGSKNYFISFWDMNIRHLVEFLVQDGTTFRGSSPGPLGQDFAYIVQGVCPFRGEEKAPNTPGDARAELIDKIKWKYDPAPYLLGYFVRGVHLTLIALERPLSSMSKPTVHTLAECNLGLKRDRIKNVSRLIRLCSLFKPIADLVAWGTIPEFALIIRDDKVIELWSDSIKKTFFGVGSHARIDKLIDIYRRLDAKGVPYTDRLTKWHKKRNGESGTAWIAPRGKDVLPRSPQELLSAIRCVLEVLEAAHAEPEPLFHRDLRWANIVQTYDDPAKWIIIDWDDASATPTKAATHLNEHNHSPRVREDLHGGEVDVWAVGELICDLRVHLGLHPEFGTLGMKMKEMLTAQEAKQALEDAALKYF